MATVPPGYDPVTLNHWLWYKVKCFEATPTEFQSLFEAVMKRAEPAHFMQVRPYGNIGDRKCDGLLFGGGVVYQVYSPDEMKQADTLAKIAEDLAGAVKEWKRALRRWVFVYNARHGLPPDIPLMLTEQKRKHKKVELDHMSQDRLWEVARGLTVPQRAEVLGAPAGYEHLFMAVPADGDELRELLGRSWFVVVQDTMTPINLSAVAEALTPDVPFGSPVWVRPSVGSLPWDEAARYQRAIVEEAIARSRDVLPRFAVFSLSQIALAIHLGFVLSDRLEVRFFQFDRDRHSWRWPEDGADTDTEIEVTGVPDNVVEGDREVVIRVSLSAIVSPADTEAAAGSGHVEIDMRVARPDVMWLRNPTQLAALGSRFRETIAAIRERVPHCSRVHLFYAGPTGGAVQIGRQINPRMNPPVVLYEYDRNSTPRHQVAFTLHSGV